jgi:hypothetical protein
MGISISFYLQLLCYQGCREIVWDPGQNILKGHLDIVSPPPLCPGFGGAAWLLSVYSHMHQQFRCGWFQAQMAAYILRLCQTKPTINTKF